MNIHWSMMTCKGSIHYWNYLEDYWPCADGLAAVNAVGTQLRGPINSALARRRMTVEINKWTPPRTSGGIPYVSTRFSLSVENEQGGAGQAGGTRLASSILRRERGQGKVNFPCSADHEQDWQTSCPVDLYSAICEDYT